MNLEIMKKCNVMQAQAIAGVLTWKESAYPNGFIHGQMTETCPAIEMQQKYVFT
jgi:hypothetical protein